MSCSTDTLPSYDEAVALLLADLPRLPAETVTLDAAAARVLRSAVVSDRDQPPFHRSAMDGYAVRADEVAAGAVLPIRGSVPAGSAAFEPVMPPGSVMKIATGAPLPRGADAVVPVEQTETLPGGGEVRFGAGATAGSNVHSRASDAGQGDEVLRAGLRLTPARIGIAATVGAASLHVSRLPRVTILTTGDEVVPPATATAALMPQQIRNSNGPLLLRLLAAMGTEVLARHHVPDELAPTRSAARDALDQSDLVITAGAVSVGERDHLPRAWQEVGARTVLHGVAIQPGKPVLVARHGQTVIVSLPGNPVSALVTAHLFAWVIVRAMTGECDAHGSTALPWRSTLLATSARGRSGRELFRACRFDGHGRADLLPWHGSGDLMHTAEAEALVRLPRSDEQLAAGDVVPILPLLG